MANIIVSVKSLVINNGEILLLQRSANARTYANEWEIVGGKLEFGETPTECVVREVFEETGLAIVIDKLLYATNVAISADTQVVGLVYLSHTSNRSALLSKEHQNYKWVDKKELLKDLNKNMLSDFITYNIFSELP